MSTLTDFYVSCDEEAAGYDAAPDGFAGRLQSKGIGPFELSLLWSLMQGVPWDVRMLDEFPCLADWDGGDRFIHKLPQPMVATWQRWQPARFPVSPPDWQPERNSRARQRMFSP